MTSKLGKDVIQVASALCINRDKLMPIRMHSLTAAVLKECTRTPSEGYNNAIISALRIGAASVVFGAIKSPALNGVIIEHAWVKLQTGQYLDPTYQHKPEGQYSMINFTYYALIEIRVENYMSLLQELKVRCQTLNSNAINFMHLRGSDRFSELFTHQPLHVDS